MISLRKLLTKLGDADGLHEAVIEALSSVYDPELPVNIYDLGLIYQLDISREGLVNIRMTLTAPGCPMAQSIPIMVADAVKSVPGVRDALVELVWEPPWEPSRMSEAAKLELGIY